MIVYISPVIARSSWSKVRNPNKIFDKSTATPPR